MNWTPKMVVLTAGPGLQEFHDNLGDDAEYIFGSSQWEPGVGGAGATDFVSSYSAAFGDPPGYHAAGGFVSGQLLEQAILRAGGVDNERVRDALATMEASTVYGTYKVDATGAQTGKPMYLLQWLGGERRIVWPQDFAEADYVLPMPAWGGR
jgi:branched-chain amino acid transport system substrate-binding protein